MYTEAFRKEKLATETGNNMTTSYADTDNPFQNDVLLASTGIVIGGLLGWALLVLCYRWVCRRGHGTTESIRTRSPGPATIPKISGLTAAALQSLGSSVVGTAPGDAENSGVWVPMDPSDSCCVCLSEFCNAETVRTLRCGHTFHQQCIDEWLTKQAVCPLCKSAVTADLGTSDQWRKAYGRGPRVPIHGHWGLAYNYMALYMGAWHGPEQLATGSHTPRPPYVPSPE